MSSAQGHDGHCAEYGERGPVHVQYDAALAYARELGAQHGRNAAEWYAWDAFSGRVTRGASESASRILDGIESGDPAILDTLPYPDLSGEWADTLTGPALVAETLDSLDPAALPDSADVDWFSDICDAYELAFSEAVSDEVARLARIELA